jgi:uncharacterized coiled-coil DUF342 family protein
MRTGECVIVEGGWADRILPPVISGVVVGVVVFLMTRLYDTFQFEKKLSELTAKLATKDELKSELAEFRSNHVAPLKERQSKFEQTVKELSHDIGAIKEMLASVVAKLEAGK